MSLTKNVGNSGCWLRLFAGVLMIVCGRIFLKLKTIAASPKDRGFELSLHLARAIESLPEHCREVVLLRDVEELTINEIASRLGKTREAVKGTLHRARLLFRESLCS